MKIVLVYPPPTPLISRYSDKDKKTTGLGLMYLATQVKESHDVTIIGGIPNPTPMEEIIEQITKLEPNVLGISTIFSTLIKNGKIIAQEIRKKFPKTTIIFGGNHATFVADELAAEPFVDIVVKGEGEVTFKELIERIDQKRSIDDVRGIVFQANGKIVHTGQRELIKDLNTIPFPDWTMICNEMPQNIPMCTSRGCPYDCIYCSTTSFWGRKWRFRSAQNMIDEINNIFDVYQPEKKNLRISFVDDSFTINQKRVKEFCRLVHQENFELEWGVSSRIELIDDELLEIMADAGCVDIFFGIESGSNRVLKLLKRHYTIDEVKAKVERCLDFGLLPTCSFMIGNPFEDKSDIEETFALLKALKSYKVQAHLFTPFIGTEVFNNAQKYCVEITTKEYEMMQLETKASLNTKYLKANEIEDLYHKGVGLVLKRHREGNLLKKIAEKNRNRRLEVLKRRTKGRHSPLAGIGKISREDYIVSQ